MIATAIVSSAVDGELVARFAAGLARLNPAGGKVGLAVSGGPDSMAMLLLADAAVPGGFEVASVDHGLRPEAAEECALVERACAERSIPFAMLKVEVGKGNLQMSARQARYAALGAWSGERGLVAIATAHHADDQAETLLMRLNRGCGVAGLAGVREQVRMAGLAVPVIRPLLRFRRAELEGVVKAAGLAAARDPSNDDDRFERVRIRKALADADWLDPLALSASAAHLAEAEEALERMADAAIREGVTRREGRVHCVPPPDRAIARRVLARIFAELGGAPRGSDIARLLDRLEQGHGGNIAGVLATVEGGEWVLRPEPPRR